MTENNLVMIKVIYHGSYLRTSNTLANMGIYKIWWGECSKSYIGQTKYTMRIYKGIQRKTYSIQ